MRSILPIIRPLLAVLAANLSGYAAFRGALGLTSGLWRSETNPAGPDGDLGLRMLFIALTAIAFAAPPVLVGALAARLAGRWRLWVGLAAGLWGFGFAWWWPATPLLGPEAWVGPAALTLLSGLIGGWLMDVRAGVKAAGQPPRA